VTKSANDVATALAEKLSGTERKFAKRMTRKAKALGMRRTVFKNASGLPNRRQKSTARDMACSGRCHAARFSAIL
jgi:D-alanyl-D-alanine carboxypeptidase